MSFSREEIVITDDGDIYVPALRTETTGFEPNVMWTPMISKNGCAGYRCQEVGTHRVTFLYFNPSTDGTGEPDVFLYGGPDNDPAYDMPYHWYTPDLDNNGTTTDDTAQYHVGFHREAIHIRSFRTEKEAAEFIGRLPDAVDGRYYLDGPEKTRTETPAERLEYLRKQLRDENISLNELAELQGLKDHIEPGDVELLEPAGVPEEDAYLAPEEREDYDEQPEPVELDFRDENDPSL